MAQVAEVQSWSMIGTAHIQSMVVVEVLALSHLQMGGGTKTTHDVMMQHTIQKMLPSSHEVT